MNYLRMRRKFISKNYLLITLLYILYCMCFIIWFYSKYSRQSSVSTAKKPFNYIVDTKECQIPDMDVFDKSIEHCLFQEESINCDNDGRGMLVKSLGNTLFVDMSVVENYGLTEENVDCCYRPFWITYTEQHEMEKMQGQDKENQFFRVHYESCIQFTITVIVDEFVQVKCTLPNNTMYRDSFIFVKERGINSRTEEDGKLNVLIIGLDSVSRLNFHRQMPKTVKYLRELDAVEMFGFNRVGFNTYPNIAPMITGLSPMELEEICLENNMTGFEECPMIWNKFNENGFITGLGEDLPLLKIFSTYYGNIPFRKQLTDFFYNTHSMAINQHLFHEKRLNYDLCFGKRLALDVLLDAVKQFMIKSKNMPKFGFFWSSSISHDYMNLLGHADDYYHTFLNDIDYNEIFEKSFVILLSDHGIRWGCARRTYQGYMEENLPYLFIKYPTWFPNRYPQAAENLRANARRLISPYDLYKTLQDLIDLNNIVDSELDNRLYDEQSTIGTSLFLPINESRTCNDAGIPDVFCACNPSEPVAVNSEKVKISAESLVTYLNYLLRNITECSKLYVEEILSARLERKAQDEFNLSHLLEDYTVTFTVGPSLAQFEGYVRFNPLKKNHTVLPPVMRITLYGTESYCIEDPILKHYCFCIV